jgi:glycosyltransferase involved in cell wall biosynthesis
MDDQPSQVNIVVSRIDSTSIIQLSLDLADDLRAAGHHVEIIEIKAYITSGRLLELYRVFWRLGSSDVFISCGALADMFLALLRLIGQGRKRWFVSYLHCDQWQDLKWQRSLPLAAGYYLLWRVSLYAKHNIICVSFDIVNNFPRRLAARSQVIYNHVATEAGDTAPAHSVDDIKAWVAEQRDNGRKIVLAFGLFNRRKNFTALIKAVEGIPMASMLLVGRGPEASALRAASKKLATEDRVLIHDFIPKPARLCTYADAYVSCSHSEGFGLANLEAARSGISVLVPCHAVNLEVMVDYLNVTFYNPHAPEHLRSELARLLNRSPIEPSCKQQTNRFSRQAFRDQWALLITNLLGTLKN